MRYTQPTSDVDSGQCFDLIDEPQAFLDDAIPAIQLIVQVATAGMKMNLADGQAVLAGQVQRLLKLLTVDTKNLVLAAPL